MAQNIEADLLQSQAETLYASLQKVSDYLKTAKVESIHTIKAKISRVQEIKQDFRQLQLDYRTYNLKVDVKNQINLNTDSFDDMFDVILAKYNALSDTYDKKYGQSEASGSQKSNVKSTHSISLPSIQLPVFSGQISEWASFINIFDSLVHANTELLPVQKLHYLRSHLIGEPLLLISNLTIEDDSYLPSYKQLTSRYANKRRTLNYYFSSILNYKMTNPKASISQFLAFHSNAIKAILEFNKKTPCLDYLLCHLSYLNLSNFERKDFDCIQDPDELPSCDKLFEFAKQRSQCYELAAELKDKNEPFINKIQKKKSFVTQQHNKQSSNTNNTNSSFKKFNSQNNSYKKMECFLCKNSHKIYVCEQFLSLSPSERSEIINKAERCSNCLSSHSDKCKSTRVCNVCGSKTHHTLLHIDSKQSIEPQVTAVCNINTHSPNKSKLSVILGTLIAYVKDSSGRYRKIRALLDMGSEISCVSVKCAAMLGLKQYNTTREILGISNQAVYCNKQIVFELSAATDWRTCVKITALIVPKICNNVPSTSFSSQSLDTFKNIKLADPNLNISSKIDMLIGCDYYNAILSHEQPVLIPGDPTLLRTKFGFVVSGKINDTLKGERVPSPSLISLCVTSNCLDDSLKRFWMQEEINLPKSKNPEDEFCENHFLNSVSRNSDGKYIVKLPFRPDAEKVGNNREVALKRFYNLEKKLDKEPILRSTYNEIMNEYIQLGHMTPALEPSSYVLPHFAVFKQSSSTSTRPVFDASVKDDLGLSLNDRLYVGPKLQKPLPDIIDQARFYKYSLSCDITQMYRNIILHPDDRKLQHIFYRFSPDEPLVEYEMTTVSFGLSCAPFLAQRVIQQLTYDYGTDFPLSSRALTSQIYIDDIFSGCNSISEGKELISQINNLLQKGGFSVKKWSSNCTDLLSDMPEKYLEKPLYLSDDQSGIKLLGLFWNPRNDCFSYQVVCWDQENTKRNVLSYISKIFDPNGWLSPVIFSVKYFIQQLWLAGIDWDTKIPEPLNSNWVKLKSQLPLLEKVKIPRSIYFDEAEYRLYGFADASDRGFGCCVYLNVTLNRVSENFLLRAKSKVAPLKKISIPRLELLGCVLLVKLLNSLNFKNLPFTISETVYFSDSKVALAWIKTPPHRLQTFVANRVTQIIEKTDPTQWCYINTKKNPADCISRGLLPSELINNQLYWKGPESIPSKNSSSIDIIVPELKSDNSCFVTGVIDSHPIIQVLERCSSLSKALSVVAYVLRFACKTKNSFNKRTGPISSDELKKAQIMCIKATQLTHFSNELSLLSNNRYNELPLQMKKLSPFLDENNVIRVGGRLAHSNLSYDTKHSYLISSDSRLAVLICEMCHKVTMHSGVSTMMSQIRKQYYIPSLRKLTKRTLKNCIKCYRLLSKPSVPYTADLPSARVQPSRAFAHTGMDYFGWFEVKESKRRNAKTYKCWCCIFVCFSSKACHIETVTDLSTEAFLAAFDRFSSRRSLPNTLYADCGTNFKGANNNLKEIRKFLKNNQDSIFSSLAFKQVTFSFSPPNAPSFGGLWETSVKSAKSLFYRSVGSQKFTLDELTTLFTRVEAVLNSRPLCYLSSSVDEVDFLTPSHLLIGHSVLNFPEECIPEESTPATRWMRVRQISQAFWRRWSKDYITTQIQRFKGFDRSSNIKEGQVVFISDIRTSPLCWPIGRIVTTHPGRDNVVRVVTIKTVNGTYVRPVCKIIPLPMVA